MEQKKIKKANFNENELAVLLAEVGLHARLLVASVTDRLGATSREKKQVWEKIAEKVNAVGGRGRSGEQVRKRWKDMKDSVKNKQKIARGTGGGPATPTVPYEELILAILGEKSTIINGIDVEGGDTFVSSYSAGQTSDKCDEGGDTFVSNYNIVRQSSDTSAAQTIVMNLPLRTVSPGFNETVYPMSSTPVNKSDIELTGDDATLTAGYDGEPDGECFVVSTAASPSVTNVMAEPICSMASRSLPSKASTSASASKFKNKKSQLSSHEVLQSEWLQSEIRKNDAQTESIKLLTQLKKRKLELEIIALEQSIKY